MMGGESAVSEMDDSSTHWLTSSTASPAARDNCNELLTTSTVAETDAVITTVNNNVELNIDDHKRPALQSVDLHRRMTQTVHVYQLIDVC